MATALVYGQNVFATGVKRYAESLQRELTALGEPVERVALARREWNVLGRPRGGFLSLWSARLSSKRGRYDVVHALDPAVSTRVSDVVTVHDLIAQTHPEWFHHAPITRLDSAFTRHYARRAHWLIADSEVTRQAAIAHWDIAPERIRTIHLGIDHGIFHPVEGVSRWLAQERPNLVFIGDDNPRKNVTLCVEALAALRERYGVEARFVRIGPSRFPRVHERYRALARERGVDLVEPGVIPDEEMVRILSHADALLWPPLAEGFGFPPLEAMACGTPVVALDTPINREICGPLSRYHANEPEDAAEAISRSLAHPTGADDLVAYARRFTWRRTAEETRKVYDLVREKQRAA